MIKANIKFNNVNDIKNFVNKVSKYDKYIDVKKDSRLLDGKSIEGLFTLQIGTVLECIIHSTLSDAKSIIEDIQEYMLTDFAEV